MTTTDPNLDPQSSGSAPAPDAELLRQAMKAFKKRMKLQRLDDESRLGHGAMTKGGSSDIQAIQAPRQDPKAVRDELVRLGRLNYVGQGLYELVKPPDNR
jgi:hypothetical protein